MDLIIDGGKYGCNAIGYLRQKRNSFVVVDVDSSCLAVQRGRIEILPQNRFRW